MRPAPAICSAAAATIISQFGAPMSGYAFAQRQPSKSMAIAFGNVCAYCFRRSASSACICFSTSFASFVVHPLPSLNFSSGHPLQFSSAQHLSVFTITPRLMPAPPLCRSAGTCRRRPTGSHTIPTRRVGLQRWCCSRDPENPCAWLCTAGSGQCLQPSTRRR